MIGSPGRRELPATAWHRGKPFSILAGMLHGTPRGFVPHCVWAEAPRVPATARTSALPQPA